MACRMCQGDDGSLYRLPVTAQLGSVPLRTACYFCYLKLTGERPPASEHVIS